jgi:hypothetical protein
VAVGVAEEEGKCPMGKNPWLATFLVVAFVLLFLAHKLDLSHKLGLW